MGHYDDAYEEEDRRAAKRRRERYDKNMKQTEELKRELYEDIPQRFRDNLEDLINWLRNAP